MSTYQYNKVGTKKMQTLKRNVDRVAPMLDLSGEWTVHDVEQDVANDILFLYQNSAIEKIEKVDMNAPEELNWDTEKSQPTSTVHIWRWNPAVKKELQEHYKNRDNLPCGHPLHICNPEALEGYSCQYCRDDEDSEMPEYTREQLNEWL